MFKSLFAFVSLAAAMIATPAMANTDMFDGARVGVMAGVAGDDTAFDDAEFIYGGVVGYDFAVSEAFLLGVEADLLDVAVDTGGVDVDNRQVSVAVRGTFPVSANTGLFLSGGYSNLNVEGAGVEVDFDGFRVGAGAEFNISERFYANAEYRYTEYDFGNFVGNAGYQSAMIGAGLRF